MNWPPSEAVARRICVAVLVAGVAGIAAVLLLGEASVVVNPYSVATLVAFVTGGLIVWNRPTNTVGWLFLWWGALTCLSDALLATAGALGDQAPRSAAWAEAVGWGVNVATTVVCLPLALLLFPTGRLLSRRWRPVVWVILVAAALGGTASLLVGSWGGDASYVTRESPLYARAGQVGEALSTAFFPVFSATWIGSAASLVVRARRARGVERQQMRWLGLGAGYTVLVGIALLLASGGPALGWLEDALIASAMAAIPAATAVAVLRHRLWDIDVVLRRSVVVAVLAAFVTSVYVLVVVGVGALLPVEDLVLSVAATALVAVLFAPLRDRTSRLANRLVYGRRATPFEVLADLSERMAGALPEEQLLEAMARRLADGTGAARTAVWLRAGDRLAAVAGWPESPEEASIPLEPGAQLPAIPDTDHAVPVLHGDRLLGALTLSTARGRELVPAERTLLTDLASSAGLVLRKAALDRDLHAQLEELAASRRRVVAAEDTARRQLERNLHDGAQQQLVALRVQLGLARTVAGREGAEALAARLDSLSATAEQAIDAVRGVAHGIYPPLLAAEGLPAALAAAARRAPLPVALDVQDDLGRHPEPVEAAVYFAAVAVLDAAGRAGATSATLTARAAEGQLTLTVSTDVPPSPAVFTAQRDRLDAVGGRLVFDGEAGEGRVIASAPISAAPSEPDAAEPARPEVLAR